MHQLAVKLKQHTPMIHFQHDQEGATIRASEVKPKLDRFMLEKLKGNQIPFRNLLSGRGEHDSLDYKMTIESATIETSIIPSRFPLYFGNMGEENARKEFRYCNGLTKVTFSTYHDEIIEMLKRYLVEFFITNNFGTRQSKGFGSFYIDRSDPLYKNPASTQIMDYRFKVKVNGALNVQWNKLFKHINLFYSALRSGINICNRDWRSIFYIKSMMFKYAKENGFQWDKKSIKEAYYHRDLSDQQRRRPDTNASDTLHFSQERDLNQKYIFKDLLGLSSSEKWLSYRKTITKSNDEIDRFKSPITFKPIRLNDDTIEVLFRGEPVNSNFLNKDINIKSNNTGNLVLKTYPDFDIDDFLDYAIFEVKLKELLGDPAYEDSETFEIIEDIFKQIRKEYE